MSVNVNVNASVDDSVVLLSALYFLMQSVLCMPRPESNVRLTMIRMVIPSSFLFRTVWLPLFAIVQLLLSLLSLLSFLLLPLFALKLCCLFLVRLLYLSVIPASVYRVACAVLSVGEN